MSLEFPVCHIRIQPGKKRKSRQGADAAWFLIFMFNTTNTHVEKIIKLIINLKVNYKTTAVGLMIIFYF